jgi:tripeptide aminopeptidase
MGGVYPLAEVESHQTGGRRMTEILRPMPAPFSSSLAEALADDLLARFLRYVQIDTQARRDRTGSPSSPGQLELGRMLVEELTDIGLADAALDANGYVTATLGPRSDGEGGEPAPTIGVIAHMDTSPDAPGSGVQPLVHEDYDGGVIELPRAGTRLDPATMPELSTKRGHRLVTSSGDTLLGADDKAGVAAIMAAVAHLAAHPELPRPRLRIGFTPDEEIGHGATLFDIPAFGASCAYTVDGSEVGEVQDETFSALEIRAVVHGVEVHPGFATGKLVNALRIAAQIIAALPGDRLTPETTSGRGGFIHPYELTGRPGRASIRAIVRDFDEAALEGHRELFARTAREVVAGWPGARLELEVERQYRNMAEYLRDVPEVMQAAEAAIAAEGLTPRRVPIRGGTDGSRLSEMGLPTPNLFTGGHEYHSVREWASVQDMAAAAATLVRLAGIWAPSPSPGPSPSPAPAG